jgi:hypothetical protein
MFMPFSAEKIPETHFEGKIWQGPMRNARLVLCYDPGRGSA